MTNIAVVILNYNGSALLRKFLPSVVRFSSTARIIVVDNGSTDDSADVIRDEFPSVEILPLDSNLGFCGGYNIALKKIEAEYYLLLNSDVEVTEGWLNPLKKILDEHPEVAAVQPKILSYQDRTHFEYAGAGGGLLDTLAYPFCRGRLFYFLEEDRGQYDDIAEIFWSSGACMMVRSMRFHEAGGFDEDFFAHMEEIDLCWRLQRAGHKIWYTGSSTVYHVGGGTLSVSNPRKTYLNFKNGLSLLFKNMPSAELWYKFPIRIVLDWIASIKFTLSGSGKSGRAVLMAHWHFFGNWSLELARRRRTKKLGFRRLPAQFNRSIVWKFFVSGIRLFSEMAPSKPD